MAVVLLLEDDPGLQFVFSEALEDAGHEVHVASNNDEAVAALRHHYPGREIVVLNVDPLGELGGGIHCATQQMPVV